MINVTDGPPWNDDGVRADIVSAMRARPRYPLLDALRHGLVGPGPAVYALFLAVTDRRRNALTPPDVVGVRLGVFGDLLRGTFPAYVGAAASLRERLQRHETTFERTVGIGPADVWVSWIAGSHPAALYMEATLMELRPILCDPQLSGLGSRQPGRGRPGRGRRVSGWDALVPSGRWGREPTLAEHAAALLHVAVRVSEPGAFEPRWAPILLPEMS